MAHVCNLSPLHRPPTPSLDCGPVQRRVRRAFMAADKPVLSTSQIVEWLHPRPGTDRHHARRSVRRVAATADRIEPLTRDVIRTLEASVREMRERGVPIPTVN